MSSTPRNCSSFPPAAGGVNNTVQLQQPRGRPAVRRRPGGNRSGEARRRWCRTCRRSCRATSPGCRWSRRRRNGRSPTSCTASPGIRTTRCACLSCGSIRDAMLSFIGRRLLTAVVQLIGLALVVFFAIRLLPADPVARLVGLNASPEAYQSSKHALGLDRPVLVQLGGYLGVTPGSSGLLEGDLGRSWVTGDPIAQRNRPHAAGHAGADHHQLRARVFRFGAAGDAVRAATRRRRGQGDIQLQPVRRIAAGILVGPAVHLLLLRRPRLGPAAARAGSTRC